MNVPEKNQLVLLLNQLEEKMSDVLKAFYEATNEIAALKDTTRMKELCNSYKLKIEAINEEFKTLNEKVDNYCYEAEKNREITKIRKNLKTLS